MELYDRRLVDWDAEPQEGVGLELEGAQGALHGDSRSR